MSIRLTTHVHSTCASIKPELLLNTLVQNTHTDIVNIVPISTQRW